MPLERGCHRGTAGLLGGIVQDSGTSKNHTVVKVSWDICDENGFHTDSTTVRGHQQTFCLLDPPSLRTIRQCCGKRQRGRRDHRQASTCRSWIKQIRAEVVSKGFFASVALWTLLALPCMRLPWAPLIPSQPGQPCSFVCAFHHGAVY